MKVETGVMVGGKPLYTAFPAPLVKVKVIFLKTSFSSLTRDGFLCQKRKFAKDLTSLP